MVIYWFVNLIPFLLMVHCDTLDVKMTDLNTNENKCDLSNSCNMNFGEVVRVSFGWSFIDGDWYKPQLNIDDKTYIFSVPNKGVLSYYVCPHKNSYQTSLLPCDIVLVDDELYIFGTTITARQARKNEKRATGVIKFHMNTGSPRSTDQPEFTINLSLAKKKSIKKN